MNFNENPLTYKEATALIRELELRYNIDSKELFDAIESGRSFPHISSDDLYEWRSFLHYKSDVERQFERVLEEPYEELDELEYSQAPSEAGDKEPVVISAANNNLALAA